LVIGKKLKKEIVSEWKSHVSKRDSWGAESSKILQLIGQHETKGVTLKKEVDLLDKKVLDLSSQLTKLRNQAEQLGLELPQATNLLDGVQLGVWGNKFVDTREIVDEFKNNLK
jgi:seryl-tRNA synthetase